MDIEKIKAVQEMIKRHQAAVVPPVRIVSPSAGRDSDDLSKVAANDIIGKGGESDLRK